MMVFHTALKKQEEEAQREKKEILESLQVIRQDLRCARNNFNNACDPELVEACVYEINALQARYAYFLRLAKEKKASEAVSHPFQTYTKEKEK